MNLLTKISLYYQIIGSNNYYKMKTLLYTTLLTSTLFADGNFETRIILFVIFIVLGLVGYKFITLRTGNHDIDYFIKLLGWLLIIPAIWGILESLNII